MKDWKNEDWKAEDTREEENCSGIHGESTTHPQRKSIPLFALFDVTCDLPQDNALQEDAPSRILSVHLHFCMFWNIDDKNTVRRVETITWISAQENNCWEVVEVHVTECHTFGLWRSICTFATGTDNQKNQMWRTKWMSVGNALVTCGLSNNVTHHLCFDRSKCCWSMSFLGHQQFTSSFASSGKDNKQTIRCRE